MKQRILVIGVFPIREPQHGGQKRAKAFIDAYIAAGHDVRFVAVYSRGAYPTADAADVGVGAETEKRIATMPELADYVVGAAISSELRVRDNIVSVIKSFKPTVIQLEQVFPYAGLREVLASLNVKPKLIYSSQNIEHEMKHSILKQAGRLTPLNLAVIKDIKELEIQLSRDADLVLAVSAGDLEEHRSYGAKTVLLAPNGMDLITPTRTSIERMMRMLEERNARKLILFVGSAHLPNWTGFAELVGFGAGWLPFYTRLGIAGGVSAYMVQDSENSQDVAKLTFWNRAIPFGRMAEADLAALLSLADVIILPISSGGGSNLKTAEALLTHKPVVASSFAFRGFDSYSALPTVRLADDRDSFRLAILAALTEPAPKLSADDITLISKVGWKECLAAAVIKVGKL